MECLECKKELVDLGGRVKKNFCNSTCRSKYWHKKKRSLNVKSKRQARKEEKKVNFKIEPPPLPPMSADTAKKFNDALEAEFQSLLNKNKNGRK